MTGGRRKPPEAVDTAASALTTRPWKYPEELRERAVRMVLEIQAQEGRGRARPHLLMGGVQGSAWCGTATPGAARQNSRIWAPPLGPACAAAGAQSGGSARWVRV